MKPYIVIIYDGINNSVFQSQVMAPLFARKTADPSLEIHIISFEREAPASVPLDNRIRFHIYKRLPFIHRFLLLPYAVYLRRFLQSFASYELLARGPFAGYIAYHALNHACTSLTVQARGLAAEEYGYALRNTLTYMQKLRYLLLHDTERTVYATLHPKVYFEAVSTALKKYVITHFHAPAERIRIAQADIPASLEAELKASYKCAVRTQLGLQESHIVYCYSGSFKPWQCPQETINYFASCYMKDKQSFLLILTPDHKAFLRALEKFALPETSYCVISVAPHKLLMYLASADYGLLLREKHIINVVSRPTKALEYRAAGLTILHNDTVPFVIDMPGARSMQK